MDVQAPMLTSETKLQDPSAQTADRLVHDAKAPYFTSEPLPATSTVLINTIPQSGENATGAEIKLPDPQAMRRETETAFERVGLPRELSQAQTAQEQAIQAGKTNRAELDAIEKLTADKGIKTRYIYNEKIASEGFISGDTMTVNLARANGEGDYAFLIAAHEAGHAMKAGDAQKFTKFQEAALRLAENDKELGAYASAMRELYVGEVEGLDEAALNEEVSLKIAQQIVMDQHKLLQAVGQDRGLIGSFLDFVCGLKNSIAIKLTNSKKAMLDEAERTLVNLLRGGAGNVEGTRYSIREDAQGKPYVEIDEDILAGVPNSKKIETVRQELRNRYPEGFNWRGWNIALSAKGINEFLRSKDTTYLRDNNRTVYNDKLRTAANLDEIITVADNIHNEDPMHPRKDNLRSFNRAYVRIRVGGNDYTAEVVTGIYPDTREIFYDIVNLKPAKIKETSASSMLHNAGTTIAAEASSGYSIPQPGENTRGSEIKLPGPGELRQETEAGFDRMPLPGIGQASDGAQGKNSLAENYRLPDGRSVREYVAQEYGKTQRSFFNAPQGAFSGPDGAIHLGKSKAAAVEAQNTQSERTQAQEKGSGPINPAEKNPLELDAVKEMLNDEDTGFGEPLKESFDLAGGLTTKGVSYSKDLSRNLDAAASGSRETRTWLRELIEKPFYAAKKAYAQTMVKQMDTYRTEMESLGIKPASRESRAVMWYGEGKRKVKGGEYESYQLSDLQRDFPDTWQNIQKADAVNRRL